MAEDFSERMRVFADGFLFPTSLAFDDNGQVYVAESGLPFGGAPSGGRVWCVEEGGERTLLLEGLRQPVNGLTFHQGALYVSEGGNPGDAGRIGRLELDGKRGYTVLLDNLPGPGNYHTNMVAFGPDGKMYFSQGAMSNTGIIGLDGYELGWLHRLPHAHDIPGHEIVLAGVNIETVDPLSTESGARTSTGAFVPFGTRTEPGQRIASQLPCTSAVMRCNPDGSGLELVAWGLRNAFALGFLPDGRLLAVDQGADDRGSRPVGNVPDLLFEVRPGAWYGWPDFIDGDPITAPHYLPERGPAPAFVLANHQDFPTPEKALLRFPPHVAAVKFDVLPADVPVYGGQLLIALFGDEAPMTVASGGPRVGRTLARIDPRDWSLHVLSTQGRLHRPIDVCYNQQRRALFVLDFGQFEMEAGSGLNAIPGSGCIWWMGME